MTETSKTIQSHNTQSATQTKTQQKSVNKKQAQTKGKKVFKNERHERVCYLYIEKHV